MIKKSKFLKWLVGNRPSELVCEAGRHQDEIFENIYKYNLVGYIDDGDLKCYYSVENQKIEEKDKEIERLNNIINEFENGLKRRIKAYEDRQALGKGYELTNVMEIQLTIDRKYLKELQELKGDDHCGRTSKNNIK